RELGGPPPLARSGNLRCTSRPRAHKRGAVPESPVGPLAGPAAAGILPAGGDDAEHTSLESRSPRIGEQAIGSDGALSLAGGADRSGPRPPRGDPDPGVP